MRIENSVVRQQYYYIQCTLTRCCFSQVLTDCKMNNAHTCVIHMVIERSAVASSHSLWYWLWLSIASRYCLWYTFTV